MRHRRNGCLFRMFPPLFLVLALFSPTAFAARPFVTDDARLTTAQSCQLESWMRVYPASTEYWALPACNFTGNLEITAGGGRAHYDDATATVDYVFQAKTLLRPLETNGIGVGFAVGKVLHPAVNPGPNLLGNAYAYLPVTLSLFDDRALVHGNIGWLRDRASKRDNLTWGLGGEFVLAGRWSAMAENFGDNRGKPYWQVGLRTFLLPERVQVDGTIGNQYGGEKSGRWISIGLRITPDHLFGR